MLVKAHCKLKCQKLLIGKIRTFLSAGVFEDEDVTHVEGDVDPVRDLEIIHEELRKKDEEYIK